MTSRKYYFWPISENQSVLKSDLVLGTCLVCYNNCPVYLHAFALRVWIHTYSVIFELDSRQRNLVEPAPTASIVQPLPSQPSTSQYAADMPNLPKLHLPKFYGDPKKWQEWCYEIIHGNPNLSVSSLPYLVGGASHHGSFGNSDDVVNYTKAIAILKHTILIIIN